MLTLFNKEYLFSIWQHMWTSNVSNYARSLDREIRRHVYMFASNASLAHLWSNRRNLNVTWIWPFYIDVVLTLFNQDFYFWYDNICEHQTYHTMHAFWFVKYGGTFTCSRAMHYLLIYAQIADRNLNVIKHLNEDVLYPDFMVRVHINWIHRHKLGDSEIPLLHT